MVGSADRVTWRVPEEVRDGVQAQLVVNSSRYHLGIYDDVDRTADVPQWTLEDSHATAQVAFLIGGVAKTWNLVLSGAPVALPVGDVRSLAAGLPCSITTGMETSTVDDCIYTAGVDAIPPEKPPSNDPFSDCRVSPDACPSALVVNLGEVRQVRRIALRGLWIESNLAGDNNAVRLGQQPQFVIERRSTATTYEPIAYVSMPSGVELLELPDPVDVRYLRVRGFGPMGDVGSIGVFE